MYGRGHHRNGRITELQWQTPPTDYLAEEEARIQALEWQQRELDTAQAARVTTDAAEALGWWNAQPESTISTDGTHYAVTMGSREGWQQSSPEELDIASRD